MIAHGTGHPRRLRRESATANQARGFRLRCLHITSWTDALTSAQPDTIPDSCKSERISALTNSSSLNSENKPSPTLVTWLARSLNLNGQRLHAETDAMARQRGWQITQRNGGLGRRYRDPRFDFLTSCPSCRGTGDADEAPCEQCGGIGRLTRCEPSLVPRGAGDA
jgi:hypothetical protein